MKTAAQFPFGHQIGSPLDTTKGLYRFPFLQAVGAPRGTIFYISGGYAQ